DIGTHSLASGIAVLVYRDGRVPDEPRRAVELLRDRVGRLDHPAQPAFIDEAADHESVGVLDPVLERQRVGAGPVDRRGALGASARADLPADLRLVQDGLAGHQVADGVDGFGELRHLLRLGADGAYGVVSVPDAEDRATV